MRPDNPELNQVILKFGGGLNTRTSEAEIDPSECVDGSVNFGLDIANTTFFRRKAFDLMDTATGGGTINGFAQLKASDGTLTTLVQSANTVFLWDGDGTFTSKGTVQAGARLRGHRRQSWVLDDVVLIADLAQRSPVLQWDGTTLSEMTHNLSGDFFARYIDIESERAFYGNVKSGSSLLPHMIVGSTRGDYDALDTTTRPASGNNAADPFFLLTPDLKPINGMRHAFGTLNFSTENGAIHKLTGADATDFAMVSLFDESNAVGEEAFEFIGNDIAYGRIGKIETVFATQQLGDVETDDLTRPLANEIKDVTSWTILYDARLQRVYCLGKDRSDVLVFHKAFIDERIRKVNQRRDVPDTSPWSRWTTAHSFAFQPTAAMNILRPTDGVEIVVMGDSNGNIYQMEGVGGQDGGTDDITATRISGVFKSPVRGELFDISGTIKYRKTFASTVTLTFLHGGIALFDQSITVSLPDADNLPLYSNSQYYNGSAGAADSAYYSVAFKGRLSTQNFSGAGRSSQFQLKVSVAGDEDFNIQEVALVFESR